MHNNLLLDDDYGGLLLEGTKPTLFKNQPVLNSSLGNSTMISSKYAQSISSRPPQINSLQVSGNFAPSTSGSVVNPSAGFKPA